MAIENEFSGREHFYKLSATLGIEGRKGSKNNKLIIIC
jgi:hypothetical protein